MFVRYAESMLAHHSYKRYCGSYFVVDISCILFVLKVLFVWVLVFFGVFVWVLVCFGGFGYVSGASVSQEWLGRGGGSFTKCCKSDILSNL